MKDVKPSRIIIPIFLIAFILFSPYLANGENDSLESYPEIASMIRENRLGEAERSLTEYLKLNKKDYIALTYIGELYLNKGDKGRALRFLKKAERVQPEYPPLHFFLGRVYFLSQDNESADREFSIFKNRMQKILNTDSPAKLLYIERLHTICDIYFTAKKYEAFRSTLEEILALDPQDATAIYNMGVYYYVSEHNRSKAYEYFKRTLDIAPEGEIAKKAKYAIEFMRKNPDPRIAPDFSFIDQEYR